MPKHQQHAAVADRQTGPLKTTDGPAVQQRTQNEHERGVEVKNQSLKRGADKGKSGKVQKTGQVVAGKAQPDHAQQVFFRQHHHRFALACAARPPGHEREKRQGQEHAQHQ